MQVIGNHVFLGYKEIEALAKEFAKNKEKYKGMVVHLDPREDLLNGMKRMLGM